MVFKIVEFKEFDFGIFANGRLSKFGVLQFQTVKYISSKLIMIFELGHVINF